MTFSNTKLAPSVVSDDDLFFTSRGGQVWACWLSGKPAVNLGVGKDVSRAMVQFLNDLRKQVASNAASPKPRPASPDSGLKPQGISAHVPPPAAPPPKVIKERASVRHGVSIPGRIFTVRGSRDVKIFDLSETGCQFDAAPALLRKDDRITVKIGPVGPVVSTVRWHRGDRYGVEFNPPLYPSVLEHIRSHFDLRRGTK